jgi:hypothetical protein
MQGTRRLEEMIAEARKMSYQEKYSYTEGWDDNVVTDIFNLGLNRLYSTITEIDSPVNISELRIDVVSQQTAYNIPQDIHMSLRIMDVRYLYGFNEWEFITLRQGMIQDRFSYPTNVPDIYCIRNNQILLSPTPNITKAQALIINFQRRMRKIDIRRGMVKGLDPSSLYGTISGISNGSPCTVTTVNPHGLSTGDKVLLQSINGMFQLNGNLYTITAPGGPGSSSFTLNGVDSSNYPPYISGGYFFLSPIKFLLDFTVTSQKDINMKANADSVLDRIDWSCFVDMYGNPVVSAISLAGYNSQTQILTAAAKYVPSPAEITGFFNDISNSTTLYVVQGDFSSSHSELDRQCEDHLIEFAVLRLLRLQSAAEPTAAQTAMEESVLNKLAIAYRKYRPSIMPIVWQERLRPRSWPWGRRGMY